MSIDTRLDKIWRERVYSNCNGRCILCGTTNSLEAHHIILRRKKSTRWAIRNGAVLCQPHHILAHSHPKYFHELLDKRFGDGFYDRLKRKGNEFFDGDYERVEKEMKGE